MHIYIKQPNRNICWLRSSTRSLQRNLKLTQFHGINFHIGTIRVCVNIRIVNDVWVREWVTEWTNGNGVCLSLCVCVCVVQSTAKLFGFNVYLRKIHPFQIQWCMSTILKNLPARYPYDSVIYIHNTYVCIYHILCIFWLVNWN